MARRKIRLPMTACFVALTIVMAVSCTDGKSAPPETSSSAASSTVAVPNVVGLDASAAEAALTNAGLSMDLRVVTGDYPDAAVLRQRPKAGTSVQPGMNVHVVVGPAPAAG